MTRSFKSRLILLAWLLAACVSGVRASTAQAPDQPPANAPTRQPARFFAVPSPLTDAAVNGIVSSAQAFLRTMAERRIEPTLVFEFAPARTESNTELYLASRLADEISTSLAGAKRTIAYVPGSVSGYGVLPILACDEIVLGEGATLGPITPDGQAISPVAEVTIRSVAARKGRSVSLLNGMLDPSFNLREVRTGDGKVFFVPAAELEEFRRLNQVVSDAPAWNDGPPGVLTADRARNLSIASLVIDQRAKLISAYDLEADLAGPGSPGEIRPVVIAIEGPIDAVKLAYVKRRIGQSVAEKNENLLIFRINSEGGDIEAIDAITTAIAGLDPQKVKTVAFIADRAVGLAALIPLACDEIVIRDDALIGDVAQILGRDGKGEPLPLEKRLPIADRAAELAAQKNHPRILARAMVDPDLEVFAALDQRSGAVVYVTSGELAANAATLVSQGTIKPAGELLTLDSTRAKQYGLAARSAPSLDDWLQSQNLQSPRLDQPTWVDSLVTLLNSSWVTGLLLFVGLFMLILELKLPGVGLPAIISALCFMLFFWSHYLGGTADQLEILFFIAGLIGVLLEIFIFPGFGVFGVTGILLILSSIVMASHTFVWPTQEYEFRQLAWTIGRLTFTLFAVIVGAVILGRFLPSLPFFRHMILVPQQADIPGSAPIKPDLDPNGPLTFLLGERGVTTTVCRPTGKARFGEYLADVAAEGVYIEANTSVEVIDVRGSTVIIQKMPA